MKHLSINISSIDEDVDHINIPEFSCKIHNEELLPRNDKSLRSLKIFELQQVVLMKKPQMKIVDFCNSESGGKFLTFTSTSVWLDRLRDKVYKKYSCLLQDRDRALRFCKSSMIMQRRAQNILEKHNVTVPEILSYSFGVDTEDRTKFTVVIAMENLKDILDCRRVENVTYIMRFSASLIRSIVSALELLQENGIHHNDTHAGNLVFLANASNLAARKIPSIAILDFDNARNSSTMATRFSFYSPMKNKKRRMMNAAQFFQWLNLQTPFPSVTEMQIAEDMNEIVVYGGGGEAISTRTKKTMKRSKKTMGKNKGKKL